MPRHLLLLWTVTAMSAATAVDAQTSNELPLCSGIFREPVPANGSGVFRFLDVRQRTIAPGRECPRRLIGNYTRLILVRDDHDQGAAMARRDSFDRLFADKQAGKLVIARLSLTKPNLSFTTTLGNISWSSGRKGQVSSADLQLSAFATPYFRVDRETVIRVEFEVVNTAGTNVTLASDALSIIGQFARPAAGGGLINAENLPQLQRTAASIDTAISKFFKEQVSEKKVLEMTPDELGVRPVTATVNLPFGWKVVGSGFDKNFGSWTLYEEEPQTSVFPPVSFNLPTAAKDKFGPYEPMAAIINGFQLTASKTLVEHLAGAEKVSAVLSDLQSDAAKDGKHRKESVQLLYSVIVGEAQRLGFNMLDSVRIADAFAHSGRLRGDALAMIQQISTPATEAAVAQSQGAALQQPQQ